MNPKPAPAPEGFAEAALDTSVHMLRRQFKAGYATVRRWCEECGVVPPKAAPTRASPPKLPTPADLAERAATLSNVALRKHYKVSLGTMTRWLLEAGIASNRKIARVRPDRALLLRPRPEDFEANARRHTRNQLRALYHVSEGLITRWIIESGVEPKTPASARTNGQRRQFSTPQADGSLIAQAAQYLRRRHANVFRADILEPHERERLPNCGIGYYVVAGKGVLPANDVLSLAQDEGFDPRAWAAI